jgi:hypothetical protein
MNVGNEKITGYKTLLGAVSIVISIVITPKIFTFLGALPVFQAIFKILGDGLLLLFVFIFPGVLSTFLYLISCKIFFKENLKDNIGWGVGVGTLTVVAWIVLTLVEGLRIMAG